MTYLQLILLIATVVCWSAALFTSFAMDGRSLRWTAAATVGALLFIGSWV